MNTDDPHAEQPIETGGVPLAGAEAAAVLLHGRGARAAGMLELATQLDRTNVAYLAPQAVRSTWYPESFLAPIERNEPWLTSALVLIEGLLERIEAGGVPRDRTLLIGFSQGGCLGSEYVARNPGRYGGLATLSGGLIGPEGKTFDYDGDLEETPVFVGCSDRDPHIPLERVHETTAVFEGLDADVTERIYEGMGHTVNADELEHVRTLLDSATERA
jgi:phospholipase/carboxylesterase